MKKNRMIRVLLAAPLYIFGCASANDDPTMISPSASTAPPDSREAKTRARRVNHPVDRLLGPDERRVAVLVVPGDALVEVDGQRVERRDGVIDLVGKVGDVHRLRAWKGAKSTEVKEMTIEEAGVNPSFVDVNEVKPVPKNEKVKSKAARFELDDYN